MATALQFNEVALNLKTDQILNSKDEVDKVVDGLTFQLIPDPCTCSIISCGHCACVSNARPLLLCMSTVA